MSVETINEAAKLGLTRRELDWCMAARELAGILQEVKLLRQTPQKWGDDLEKMGREAMARFGFWRLHPSVGQQLHPTREIRLIQQSDRQVRALLGDAYWGQSASKEPKGKTVRRFPSLRAAINDLYGLLQLQA